MLILEHLKSRSLILEAKEPYREIETDACSTLSTQLGFAHHLLSLSGCDPLNISAVFSATERISNSIAMMPWNIKEKDNKEIPYTHYFYHLFDSSIQTQFTFTKNIIKDVIIHGDGYAYIKRDSLGKPVSLHYLPYGSCSPIYSQSTDTLYYNIPLYSKKQYIEPINVLHFYMLSEDGVRGRALLDFAKNTIRLAQYTEKATTDYFSSGCRLTGVLSTTAPRLTEQQRNDIRNAYLAGMSSGSGIAVLENGMTFSSMSNNAKDSSLIDTRTFNVHEIARYFSMSPVLLGCLEHSQYGSVEQAQMDFVTNSLQSYVTMFEQELNRKLIMSRDRARLSIDLDENILIKSDHTSYANYLSTLATHGFISINEGRKMLNLPEIPEGDHYILPYSGTIDKQGNVNTGYNKSNSQNVNQETNNEPNKE